MIGANIMFIVFLIPLLVLPISCNKDPKFKYLDPVKLCTKTKPSVQRETALKTIRKYTNKVSVEVNPLLFSDNKDVFKLQTVDGKLHIEASTGVAALWGFNYYLKKYCNSHIGWQVKRIEIPSNDLPEVNEEVIANDRFRYYQNVCTFSYSFVWWNIPQWVEHIEWMALNGINLALAPVDQEAAWSKVYKSVGMTDKEIDEHFTGPAFLSWLRMGNIHGWGGPLLKSWHDRQNEIQNTVIQLMYDLGMVPVLPSFNGHVPKAFKRIYPNMTFHTVENWNNFNASFCCGLFLNPSEALFKDIGQNFLKEIIKVAGESHIYAADSFNEINIGSMTVPMIQDTSKAIFSGMTEVDKDAVWVIQNWMFVNNPETWSNEKARAFLTAVPKGRMLILDLQSELCPKYDIYEMYFGQPFIWCLLHNFGGTLGMIGKMPRTNTNVYKARTKSNSTMIGIGLTPEGINQNYIAYDFMLETAWRKYPENNLSDWVVRYAERRYGCINIGWAWNILLRSIYSYDYLDEYNTFAPVFTRTPSLSDDATAWYKSQDLFQAFNIFAFAPTKCNSQGFYHDLVDITRQALQYRAEQIYNYNLRNAIYITANVSEYNISSCKYLEAMYDIREILASNDDFTITNWLTNARSVAANEEEIFHYELNARNQITLWGPEGEISDYAAKQWAEMLHFYYIPRWKAFLSAALQAKLSNTPFNQGHIQRQILEDIEKKFVHIPIEKLPKKDSRKLARIMFKKWAHMPGLPDLPLPNSHSEQMVDFLSELIMKGMI